MKRHCFSTMYGVGLLRGMPGTFGSVVAALMAYPILLLPLGYLWLVLAACLFALLGTHSSTRFMRDRNTTHDPKEIVIDELVGQWLTYGVWYGWLYAIAGNASAARHLLDEVSASPIYLLLGFVLFRLFDIVKPWPISWADRRIKGGFGVMFDDILAAIPAGTVLYVFYLCSPFFTGSLESHP